MIPTPDGKFMCGGLNRDFKQYWADLNENGCEKFTKEEMHRKLINLRAKKSKL